MKIHKILWLVIILSATAVVSAAILYKLVKKKELLDPKYQVLIAIVQSSQLYMLPIFLIVHTFFGCNNFYNKSRKVYNYITEFGLSFCLLSAVFLISPAGLILIKNNTSSLLVENIFSILSLISLFIFARVEVSSLTARTTHQKNLGVMFYDKNCKP